MKRAAASRRSFIFLSMSMIQGIWMLRPKNIEAVKQKGKNIVSRLEMELLESSKPKREMLISSGIREGKTTLYRQKNNQQIAVCSLNHTGNMIWELCDGNHGIEDICRTLVDRCQVTEARARRDILPFLRRLQAIGAVSL